MMLKNSEHDALKFSEILSRDSPYQPGTLVLPRLGYFYPNLQTDKINKNITEQLQHPCGIVLGPSVVENEYVPKEFYRVRFGNTTYERVHPVQMEVINEV